MEHLMNQPVLWEPKIDTNGYGQPIYGGPKKVFVRWEDTINVVKNNMGEEFVSSAMIFTFSALKEDDRLTYEGVSYVIRKASRIPGGDGSIHHREVYV